MTIYATGNPVGSTNPKDLIDNAQNLDYLILGPLLSYPDRRGVNRLSLAGIEASFAAAQAQRTADFNTAQAQRAADYAASEANRGYENPVPYDSGIALTRVTQLVQYGSELYKAKAGTLPWTTTGVWATDSAKLVSVGDNALRQDLASHGADMNGYLPEGTGAVSHTVRDKLNALEVSIFDYMTPAQIANVKSGTPTMDVSAVILAAIRASSGKRLVFQPATAYPVDQLVVVYASEVSNCEIDFKGQKILWRGDRKTDGSQGQQYDWNWGVVSFKGEVLSTVSATLSALLPDGSSTLTLPGHALAVGDHAFVKITDPAAGGSTLLKFKLFSRHCRVVGVVGNDVTFDFRTAFDMPSGAPVSVSKLRPMVGITVKNPNIEDVSAYPYGGATTDDQKWKGASGIVFEYAAFCHSFGGKFKGIPKVSLEAQACYGCSFGNSELDTPKETVSGGYLCKFEDSLNCFAKGLRADNERHVIDFTASSNCVAEQCGSWKTANASFVTHGTYEHDITWRDCWGYMSMAGSGTDFGQKNRRMKVERHKGSNLNIASTGQNVYDSVFEDSRFTSVSYLNLDGNTYDRCDFGNLTTLQQNGSLSGKKTVFNDTYLNQVQSPFIPAGVTSDLEFHGGLIYCLAAADILGTGKVLLDKAAFSSAGSPTFSGARLTVDGGTFELRGASTIITCTLPYLAFLNSAEVKAGFNYTGSSGAHEIVLGNSKFDLTGKTTSATFALAKTGGSIDLRAANNMFDRTGSTDRHLTAVTSGAALHITDMGNTYKGGSIRVDTGPLSGGSLIHTNNTTVGTTLTLPASTTNIVNVNNIAL
jgi:hypothetical protein